MTIEVYVDIGSPCPSGYGGPCSRTVRMDCPDELELQVKEELDQAVSDIINKYKLPWSQEGE